MEPSLYLSHIYVLLSHYHSMPDAQLYDTFDAPSAQIIKNLCSIFQEARMAPQAFFPEKYLENDSRRHGFYRNVRNNFRLAFHPDHGLQLQHLTVYSFMKSEKDEQGMSYCYLID